MFHGVGRVGWIKVELDKGGALTFFCCCERGLEFFLCAHFNAVNSLTRRKDLRQRVVAPRRDVVVIGVHAKDVALDGVAAIVQKKNDGA